MWQQQWLVRGRQLCRCSSPDARPTLQQKGNLAKYHCLCETPLLEALVIRSLQQSSNGLVFLSMQMLGLLYTLV